MFVDDTAMLIGNKRDKSTNKFQKACNAISKQYTKLKTKLNEKNQYTQISQTET